MTQQEFNESMTDKGWHLVDNEIAEGTYAYEMYAVNYTYRFVCTNQMIETSDEYTVKTITNQAIKYLQEKLNGKDKS